MNHRLFIPLVAAFLLLLPSCDRSSTDLAKKIAALEQKNLEAEIRQQELEHQLEDQKLAADRDAIERERMKIEEDRVELERQKGETAAAEDEQLRKREEALNKREGLLEQTQSTLNEKEGDLNQRAQQLSDRDRERAGRAALAIGATEPSKPVADYGIFYDSLSTYGSWFETSDYGYVWQPAVVRDLNWRPYARGYWVCSDRGWTWMSDEPYGWATYHYGRWALLRGRGWVWVPGSEWAPSWVSWRESDSHIGWAPLPPETLAYRGHNWGVTVDEQFGTSAVWYNFVETRHFGGSIYNCRVPAVQNVTLLQQTVNITNIHIENRQVIAGGPRYDLLAKRVGKPLPFYRLELDQHPRQTRDSSGFRPQFRGSNLTVTAPNVDTGWNEGLKPKRVKGRLESVRVERDTEVAAEVANHFNQSRKEGRENAEEVISELGGRESFDRSRLERLRENRQQADLQKRTTEKPKIAQGQDQAGALESLPKQVPQAMPDAKSEVADRQLNEPAKREVVPAEIREKIEPQPAGEPRAGEAHESRREAMNRRQIVSPQPVLQQVKQEPTVDPVEPKPQLERRPQADEVRKDMQATTAQPREEARRKPQLEQQQQTEEVPKAPQEAVTQQREEAPQKQQLERQQQTEEARKAQQEAVAQQREEAQQKQQLESQQKAEESRKAQQEAMAQQREEALQKQQLERQQQTEEARKAQQEAVAQQREETQQKQQLERQQQTEEARKVQQEAVAQQREEAQQKQQLERQQQAEEARKAQQEAMAQQREEAQQRQQLERQQQAEEARKAQQEAMAQQREEAQQRQQLERQQQAEEARKAQQEAMAQQREEAQQRQQQAEEARKAQRQQREVGSEQ